MAPKIITVEEAFGHEPMSFITTTDEAVALVRSLPSYARVAMDTETVRQEKIDAMTAQMVVMSISADHGPGTDVQTWVLDVRGMDRIALGRAFQEAGQGRKFNRLSMFGWNAGFDDPVTTMNLTCATSQTYKSLLFWEDLMLYEAALRLGAVGNTWYSSLADAAKRKLGIKLEGKGTVQLSYDAVTPLTEEQVRYAGYDSRVTLELATVLCEQVQQAGLEANVAASIGSRPVWAGMNIYGIEFDTDDWRTFIDASDVEAGQLMTRISELTGGGQPTLFSEAVMASFNPGSDVDVKKMLNEYAREQVLAYTTAKEGKGRLLGKTDSVDKDQLKLIGGELAMTIMAWRSKSKIRTSFGDNILKLVGSDSRLHPEYTQNLIETGRSSSRNPNLQAITPHAKPRMRPTYRIDENGNKVARVLVQGDYSQAELRVLAQLSDEKVFKDAFTAGRDLHEATAEEMFGINMAELHDADPKAYKQRRSMAKPLNFGIAYGMREGLLAQNLTVGGTPTTREEAKGLLERWYKAMTGAGKWLNERDAQIDALAANLPACDFESSWRLHLLWQKADTKSRDKTLRAQLGRRPEADEIAAAMCPSEQIARELSENLGREASSEEVAAEFDERVRAIEWARSYIGSTVLLADGTPFSFESRTLGGRRRLFQVSTESWVTSMAYIAATSRKPLAAAAREAFEAARGVVMSETDSRGNRVPLKRPALKKVFEDKELKLSYVQHVLESMPAAADYLMRMALGDCVKGLGNAYRNAPIQGAVADAAELCFANLWPRLEAETTHAHVILSVHDSVVVECDLAEAQLVEQILTEEMVRALEIFCPDVPVKADVDIQVSAHGEDIISADDIDSLQYEWQDQTDTVSVKDLVAKMASAVAAGV